MTLKAGTPLFLAAKTGNVETVQLLLDEGANFAITDLISMTVLLLVVKKGNLEPVRLLLNKCARIEAMTMSARPRSSQRKTEIQKGCSYY